MPGRLSSLFRIKLFYPQTGIICYYPGLHNSNSKLFMFKGKNMGGNMKKPLARSRTNFMIGGVCGGIAEYIGWDPTVVRLLYVLISVISAAFPGILFYILAWLIIPRESG
jgi:phage shock protein C